MSPLTKKGKKIRKAMVKTYGKKKAKKFSTPVKKKGKIKGIKKNAKK